MISKIWHGKFRFWGERKTWYSHVQEEKSVKRHYWLQKREDGSKRSDSLLYSYAHFPSPWKIPPLHAFLLCFSSFFTFVMEKWWKKIEKTRKSGKNIISTSKRHAEHPFAGQNTQHTTGLIFPPVHNSILPLFLPQKWNFPCPTLLLIVPSLISNYSIYKWHHAFDIFWLPSPPLLSRLYALGFVPHHDILPPPLPVYAWRHLWMVPVQTMNLVLTSLISSWK